MRNDMAARKGAKTQSEHACCSFFNTSFNPSKYADSFLVFLCGSASLRAINTVSRTRSKLALEMTAVPMK